jgi:hypothetical protein
MCVLILSYKLGLTCCDIGYDPRAILIFVCQYLCFCTSKADILRHRVNLHAIVYEALSY